MKTTPKTDIRVTVTNTIIKMLENAIITGNDHCLWDKAGETGLPTNFTRE